MRSRNRARQGVRKMTEEEDRTLERRITFWIVMGAQIVFAGYTFAFLLANLRDSAGWHIDVLLKMLALVGFLLLMYLAFAEMMRWVDFDEQKMCVKKFGFRKIIQKYEIAYKDIVSVEMRYGLWYHRYSGFQRFQAWTIRVRAGEKIKTYRRVPIGELDKTIQDDLLLEMKEANKSINWDIPMNLPKKKKQAKKRKT